MADGHEISIEEAAALTAAYRLSGSYDTNDGRIATAFNKEALKRLLNQEECMGIRCYYANDVDGLLTLVLVGYDDEGNDLLDQLAEFGNPCPDNCSNDNALNS